MNESTTTPPLIPLVGLRGNDVPTLSSLQQALAPHTTELMVLWWFLWFIVGIIVIRHILRYGRRTDDGGPEFYSD